LAENLLFQHPPKNIREGASAHGAACGMRRRIGASRARSSARQSINFTLRRLPNTFERRRRRKKFRAEDLPLDERLANYIIQGTRDG